MCEWSRELRSRCLGASVVRPVGVRVVAHGGDSGRVLSVHAGLLRLDVHALRVLVGLLRLEAGAAGGDAHGDREDERRDRRGHDREDADRCPQAQAHAAAHVAGGLLLTGELAEDVVDALTPCEEGEVDLLALVLASRSGLVAGGREVSGRASADLAVEQLVGGADGLRASGCCVLGCGQGGCCSCDEEVGEHL
ncbi:hypothetical protein PMAYCL1PPCAC_21249, partial [Pristionchus mayeri]